jgi:hypothetical protein
MPVFAEHFVIAPVHLLSVDQGGKGLDRIVERRRALDISAARRFGDLSC